MTAVKNIVYLRRLRLLCDGGILASVVLFYYSFTPSVGDELGFASLWLIGILGVILMVVQISLDQVEPQPQESAGA